MINGNLTEFMDILYYGGELLFEYNKVDYFIQGWTEEGLCTIVLDDLTKPDPNGYVWKYSSHKMRECADKFLNEPLWDGKSFMDIQKDVIWKDF